LIAATTAVSTIAAGAGAIAGSGSSSGGGSSPSRGPSSGGGGSSGGGSSGGGSSGGGSKDREDFLDNTDALDINEQDMDRIARRQAQKIAVVKTLNRKSHSQEAIGISKVKNQTRTIFKLVATEISKLSFTLAGSTIVLFTLSGQTRKVAMIATGVAIFLHFANVFSDLSNESRENDATTDDTAIGN
jgi:hypothetical protein